MNPAILDSRDPWSTCFASFRKWIYQKKNASQNRGSKIFYYYKKLSFFCSGTQHGGVYCTLFSTVFGGVVFPYKSRIHIAYLEVQNLEYLVTGYM